MSLYLFQPHKFNFFLFNLTIILFLIIMNLQTEMYVLHKMQVRIVFSFH